MWCGLIIKMMLIKPQLLIVPALGSVGAISRKRVKES
jgi:hypothetical protein